MTEIEIADPQSVSLPPGPCCNCGSDGSAIRIVETTLRWTMYLGFGGSELRVKLPLPYCKLCCATAHRVPMGFGSRLLVWALCWVLGLAFVPQMLGLRWMSIEGTLAVVGAIAAALVWGWAFVVARPRGDQTSYYQPVRLRDFGNVLAFTNRSYAETFLAANPHSTSAIHLDLPEAYDRQRSLRDQLLGRLRRLIPSRRSLRTAGRWAVAIAAVLAAFALKWWLATRL